MKRFLEISQLLIITILILSCDFTTGSNSQEELSQQGSDEIPKFCKNNHPDFECIKLSTLCLLCSYEEDCIYGNTTKGNCSVPTEIVCKGSRKFQVDLACAYCYQLSSDKHICGQRGFCEVTSSGQERQVVNCTVTNFQHCLGRKKFLKSFRCNWTSGYRWSTSLLLSITLGGFGVDRFYLGHWEEGLGKLFSFGGLGVWTLVDIVLIGVGYITPADGSLFIF